VSRGVERGARRTRPLGESGLKSVQLPIISAMRAAAGQVRSMMGCLAAFSLEATLPVTGPCFGGVPPPKTDRRLSGRRNRPSRSR
jgi:hypothetical protein